MKSIPLMAMIGKELIAQTQYDLFESLSFTQQTWFWRNIVQHKLMRYLDFAHDLTLVETANSLLYAYTYPGTMESIIRLSHGLLVTILSSLSKMKSRQLSVLKSKMPMKNFYFPWQKIIFIR